MASSTPVCPKCGSAAVRLVTRRAAALLRHHGYQCDRCGHRGRRDLFRMVDQDKIEWGDREQRKSGACMSSRTIPLSDEEAS